ncbi:hypothetical protein, conserved [Plasmodium gonderi]|uniref:Uncharacterized protein n=1 Tax=Plasmodium gonderi TaxID=77519 RepID=A0A1Y1JKH9_PLAGO|nr:hypothetical protein, conserved [Plasmodium gonderi]GAW83019.1 hypothetical protein, conserved [Plasmodium gonderi]
MDEGRLKYVNTKLLEETKNKGNELFRCKKYEEALSVYLSAISQLCNGPVDSLQVQSCVQFFQNKCRNNGNNEKKEENVAEGADHHTEMEEMKKDCTYVNHLVKNLFINICHNISLCYYFLDRFEEAIEYCLYINEIDKEHYKSYHTLGQCYEKLKDYKKCIQYFERCKVVLAMGKSASKKETHAMGGNNINGEICRINDKLKKIFQDMEDEKQEKETITIDMIKKIILDVNATEEEKIKMIHSIYKHSLHTLLRENIFELFSKIMNHSNTTLVVQKECLFIMYKLMSKLEREEMKKGNEKYEISRSNKMCINRLSDIKFEFYYDTNFVKMILSFHELFDEQWINNYVKNQTKKMENFQFEKDEYNCNIVKDSLIFIINIVKYVHAINNQNIVKIINAYFLNSGNRDIASSALDVIIFLCKKKKFFIQRKNTSKEKNQLNFIQTLKLLPNFDIHNSLIEFHFGDIYKHPLCINHEIKKMIQQCISMYDDFSNDVEYALILIFTLLYDKNRPSEKDIEMNDLIYECINLYFKTNEICVEWFLSVKCLFLVDKNIVLNYLIGKNEYMFDILNFINNSVGRKSKKYVSLYIDVLLLLLNIAELRFMLNSYIDVYINILKTLNYDENFLKLLVGLFKLYMHNKDFKEEIIRNIDLFFYAKEMLKRFLQNYYTPEVQPLANGYSSDKHYSTHLDKKRSSELSTCSAHTGTSSLSNDKKNCRLIDKREDQEASTKETQNEVENGTTNPCAKYDVNMLKDVIEMLFYLSLHIEFKKQLLEDENNYILLFLIKVGDDINQKKLDNTYKYLYCNTINNLILSRTDEKARRREINKANLSNFDPEQIEALEQFYDKLPTGAKPKTDLMYDYGDEETSNQLINLLLYNENYQKKVSEKSGQIISMGDGSSGSSCTTTTSNSIRYKNGTIISTIYNFINTNFFTTNIAEAVCEIISKFVKNSKNIGLVLVNNGLKTLLLASKHISKKKNCALALSEIFIYTNPKLIHFYEAYDSLPLLIDELSNEDELLVFKTLMAITNILTIDENVAIKAMHLNLWNKCFDIIASENDCIRAASLECICNLCSQTHVHQYVYDKYQKITKQDEKNKEFNFVDMQIIYSFTMEYKNYKAVFASTGALGMLSSDLRLPMYLIRTKGFHHILSSFEETNDQPILLRILTFFNNVILSENVPVGTIKKIRDAVRVKTDLNEENTQIANLILQ